MTGAAAASLATPIPDAGELTDRRRQVEQLVCDLPGGSVEERAFEQPWEIRAFALAVTAHQSRQFDWPQFQQSLIESIDAWESREDRTESGSWSYYEHWLTALEGVLVAEGLIDEETLDGRTEEVLATPANRNHHEAFPDPIAIDPSRG